MIRAGFSILIVALGFLVPSWIFLGALFLGAVLFRNFWEAIVLMVVVNSVYVYNGASFQAIYVVWGVFAYLVSYFIHTRTRFKSDFEYQKK